MSDLSPSQEFEVRVVQSKRVPNWSRHSDLSIGSIYVKRKSVVLMTGSGILSDGPDYDIGDPFRVRRDQGNSPPLKRVDLRHVDPGYGVDKSQDRYPLGGDEIWFNGLGEDSERFGH